MSSVYNVGHKEPEDDWVHILFLSTIRNIVFVEESEFFACCYVKIV